jgi:hypothetical protein
LNGDLIHSVKFTYGYGDHALDVMMETCVKLGKLPKRHEKEVAWKYLDRVAGRKNWNYTDTQVSRKKDM